MSEPKTWPSDEAMWKELAKSAQLEREDLACEVVSLRAEVARLKAASFVPGEVYCAKCTFALIRTKLYMGSGTTGPGDNATEPCPNGCGPMWPVTWEKSARDAWTTAEEMLEREQAEKQAREAAEARLCELREAVEALAVSVVTMWNKSDIRDALYAALAKSAEP